MMMISSGPESYSNGGGSSTNMVMPFTRVAKKQKVKKQKAINIGHFPCVCVC
jgi:hypothetical protein